MMEQVKPFRFDTEFTINPTGSSRSAEESLLELAALRTEMEAMRAAQAQTLEQARNEGFLEGLAQARFERDHALLAALDALQSEWEEFADHRDAMVNGLHVDASLLARAIGEALAARALTETPDEAIDQAIGRVLRQIARGQELVIVVHPDIASDVEARIAQRQAQDRRRLHLSVEGDPAMPLGDAHLRWEGGGLRLDAAERARAILNELEALGASGGDGDSPATPGAASHLSDASHS